MIDTRFDLEIRIHKEFYVLVEGFTKNQISLNPFLSQGVSKMTLSCLLSEQWVVQISQGSPHKEVAQGQPLSV
jgi:hypothetical protein